MAILYDRNETERYFGNSFIALVFFDCCSYWFKQQQQKQQKSSVPKSYVPT